MKLFKETDLKLRRFKKAKLYFDEKGNLHKYNIRPEGVEELNLLKVSGLILREEDLICVIRSRWEGSDTEVICSMNEFDEEVFSIQEKVKKAKKLQEMSFKHVRRLEEIDTLKINTKGGPCYFRNGVLRACHKNQVLNYGVNWQEFINEDTRKIYKIAKTLRIGDTLEEFDRQLGKKEKDCSTTLGPEMFGKVKISFERKPENNKENTFDRIRAILPVRVYGDELQKRKWILENQKTVKKHIFKEVVKNNQFLKYDIPPNYLKLETIVYSKQKHEIHAVFELKNV